MGERISEVEVIERIRRHILFAGYTYTEAARAVGMSHSTIYRRLNGQRAFELAEILSLADLCEVDACVFFRRQGAGGTDA